MRSKFLPYPSPSYKARAAAPLFAPAARTPHHTLTPRFRAPTRALCQPPESFCPGFAPGLGRKTQRCGNWRLQRHGTKSTSTNPEMRRPFARDRPDPVGSRAEGQSHCATLHYIALHCATSQPKLGHELPHCLGCVAQQQRNLVAGFVQRIVNARVAGLCIIVEYDDVLCLMHV